MHRILIFLIFMQMNFAQSIDREQIVKRNSPSNTSLDIMSPFSVGNGGFTFTADATGLQSFGEMYDAGIELHTMTEWAWHSFPNIQKFSNADATDYYEQAGRKVPYLSKVEKNPASNFLRANPHRVDIGRIGFVLGNDPISEIHQSLHLYTGLLESEFVWKGKVVQVKTVCSPSDDLIAVEVKSEHLKTGELKIKISFPAPSDDWRKCADWTKPEIHKSVLEIDKQPALIKRSCDDFSYLTKIAWQEKAALTSLAAHEFLLGNTNADTLHFTVHFSKEKALAKMPNAEDVMAAAAAHWKKFWHSGAAIDLSESKDSRWHELERRVILSQYLTAIQCAGTQPPQETGLTMNSWHGKAHLEMHWWHAAHFALWNRPELLERTMPWYLRTMPVARANVERQGFKGIRWPKMIDPNGNDSPSGIAVFLFWQQPHPMYFAELLWQKNEADALKKYHELMFSSADFIADFFQYDEKSKRYILGPVLIPAQESYSKTVRENINPTYELAYAKWALQTAQHWRELLGLPRDKKWNDVIQKISSPHIRNGIYTAIENDPFTIYEDHPSMLAAYGFVPDVGMIQPAIMKKTYDDVLEKWDWKSTWGWDYPVLAMTCAKLGMENQAYEALLMNVQKNRYLNNGHNYQDQRLMLYLPGNGGLLSAIAHIAKMPDKKSSVWHMKCEGF